MSVNGIGTIVTAVGCRPASRTSTTRPTPRPVTNMTLPSARSRDARRIRVEVPGQAAVADAANGRPAAGDDHDVRLVSDVRVPVSGAAPYCDDLARDAGPPAPSARRAGRRRSSTPAASTATAASAAEQAAHHSRPATAAASCARAGPVSTSSRRVSRSPNQMPLRLHEDRAVLFPRLVADAGHAVERVTEVDLVDVEELLRAVADVDLELGDRAARRRRERAQLQRADGGLQRDAGQLIRLGLRDQAARIDLRCVRRPARSLRGRAGAAGRVGHGRARLIERARRARMRLWRPVGHGRAPGRRRPRRGRAARQAGSRFMPGPPRATAVRRRQAAASQLAGLIRSTRQPAAATAAPTTSASGPSISASTTSSAGQVQRGGQPQRAGSAGKAACRSTPAPDSS